MLDKIIFPVIRSYFSVLSRLGIQLELHGQNALLGLNDTFKPIGIVVRDLGDAGKDLSLRRELGVSDIFLSNTYKCIERHQTEYQKIHSFMFDFKVGEYIFEPIIKEVISNFRVKREAMISNIKEFVNNELLELPDYIFPQDGSWYSFDKTRFGTDRFYTRNLSPNVTVVQSDAIR